MFLRLDKECLKTVNGSTRLGDDTTERVDINLCAVEDVLIGDELLEPCLNLERRVSTMFNPTLNIHTSLTMLASGDPSVLKSRELCLIRLSAL